MKKLCIAMLIITLLSIGGFCILVKVALDARDEVNTYKAQVSKLEADLSDVSHMYDAALENYDKAKELADQREKEIKTVRRRASAVFQGNESARQWGAVSMPDDLRSVLAEAARSQSDKAVDSVKAVQ